MVATSVMEIQQKNCSLFLLFQGCANTVRPHLQHAELWPLPPTGVGCTNVFSFSHDPQYRLHTPPSALWPIAAMYACSRHPHPVQTARRAATAALRPVVAASRLFTSSSAASRRAWASVACSAQDDNRQASTSSGVVMQEPAATSGSTAESTWTKIKKFGVAGKITGRG